MRAGTTRGQAMIRTTLLATIFALSAPALASDVIAPDRPYIFTPSHAGKAQYVRFGAPVQVQLPGGPTTWQVEQLVNAEQTGTRIYPSPGRVPGTSTVLAFDFKMLERDKAVITLFSTNVPAKFNPAIPTGRYRITLVPFE